MGAPPNHSGLALRIYCCWRLFGACLASTCHGLHRQKREMASLPPRVGQSLRFSETT